jgi:hypothetical protein
VLAGLLEQRDDLVVGREHFLDLAAVHRIGIAVCVRMLVDLGDGARQVIRHSEPRPNA